MSVHELKQAYFRRELPDKEYTMLEFCTLLKSVPGDTQIKVVVKRNESIICDWYKTGKNYFSAQELLQDLYESNYAQTQAHDPLYVHDVTLNIPYKVCHIVVSDIICVYI
jgi:hypothetical protein